METTNRRILLVDDDARFRQRLKRGLRRRGFATACAENGASGLLAIHAQRPDLVVLDTEMPVMDGYQVLRVLRGHPDLREIPVILLTSGRVEEEISRGWLYGADSCLPHGVGAADLILMIERSLTLGRGTGSSRSYRIETLQTFAARPGWEAGHPSGLLAAPAR